MSASTFPWHATPLATVSDALGHDRLAHAILVHGMAGLGKRALADRIAALAVCQSASACGNCPPCHWFSAGNHPDVYRVAPEDDKKTISVDQVRALIGKLGLASHSGGRKVALVTPADLMTEAAANALLKTLEEPSGESAIILVADRLSALPVTIVSRCQALPVPRPATDVALGWLEETAEAAADWPALLRLAHGAPLAALTLASDGFGERIGRLSADLKALQDGSKDPGSVAASWVKLDAARCLSWMSRRVSDLIRVRSGVAGSDVAHNLKPEDLPASVNQIKLTALFQYLDTLQQAERRLGTSLNAQQVVEAVLVPWATGLR
ncbi:MAG: DNA polymerase III subunit delta' [Pseudomonadota bacterium]